MGIVDKLTDCIGTSTHVGDIRPIPSFHDCSKDDNDKNDKDNEEDVDNDDNDDKEDDADNKDNKESLIEFNIPKLKDEETKQHYQVEISNRFTALASSDEVEEKLDVNSVWKNIRDNIKIVAEQNIGYYETKKKKHVANRKANTTIHSEAREIIANIIEKCDEERVQKHLRIPLNTSTERAAEYTGVGYSIIKKIRKEHKIRKENSLDRLLKSPGKKRLIISRNILHVDDFDKCVIRNTIQDFYIQEKRVPTIPKLLTDKRYLQKDRYLVKIEIDRKERLAEKRETGRKERLADERNWQKREIVRKEIQVGKRD
ncbi:hypothetical protein ANN_19651 [Periplaneta americana]|uniref:Uncharacterized protein n=1 Tax=Periplaneta americana TaxID=6978 RepID=A0ABQ8SAP4_PERAM|nr:hypothetical protein ANN_19651 [Periplaneta americana]